MVLQVHQNWEEHGDIQVHTFKYGGVLKTEFYFRLDGKWPRDPFVVIGIDLNSLNVFFRCSRCLYGSHWEEALKARPSKAHFYRGAALRLYSREVNIVLRRLGFAEREEK